jgi:hypothetical protein
MSGCLMGCNDTSRHGIDAGSRDGTNNDNGPRLSTSTRGMHDAGS